MARSPGARAVRALDLPASGGSEWSYQALRDRATALADELAATGVSAGAGVVLALPNSVEFILHFLALARLGACVLLVSPRYGSTEVEAIAARARPAFWIGRAGRSLLPSETTWPVRARRDLGDGVQVVRCETVGASPFDASDAVVKFSSGSTGEPKGVRLEASALLAEAEQVARTLDLAARDRVVARVPLVHSYGFDLGLLAPLLNGAELGVGEGFIPRLALRELAGATILLGVPSMYRLWLECGGSVSAPELRWALSCTAPLAPETIGAVHRRFGLIIAAHYSASECGAITNHRTTEVLGRPLSVGHPVHGVRLAVQDEAGRELPAGESGEIVVQSAAIARGILGLSAADAPISTAADGGRHYRTGDLGRLDADGFLTLEGRRDALINVGGLKVSPFEVEAVLESHPAVSEALARAERGRDGECYVIALVVPRASTTEVELREHCHGRLAEHKRPRRVEIVPQLPRSAGGKLDRRPVREEGT
ncbi:MAG: class I adenylate-forming enzyme family protein [Candidatus Eisenbacteria bacterium]